MRIAYTTVKNNDKYKKDPSFFSKWLYQALFISNAPHEGEVLTSLDKLCCYYGENELDRLVVSIHSIKKAESVIRFEESEIKKIG